MDREQRDRDIGREENGLKMAEGFEPTNSALFLDMLAGCNAVVMGFRWRKVVGVEKEDHGAVDAIGQGDELLEAYPRVVGIGACQV